VITLGEASVLFERELSACYHPMRKQQAVDVEKIAPVQLNSARGTQLGLKRALPMPADFANTVDNRHREITAHWIAKASQPFILAETFQFCLTAAQAYVFDPLRSCIQRSPSTAVLPSTSP
jgi:hypothetical protein